MKHILRCAAILAVLALGFSLNSCKNDTDDDSNGSVTVRVTGEMAAKIAGEARSARSADDGGSDTDGLFFDIALKGGYSASKTLAVAEGAAATFSDIPVGTTLYAEGEAYRTEDGEKVILYTGKSEKITIQEGVNTLSLKMQKVKQDEPAAETYTVTIADGITNGTVAADKKSAAKGDTVTLTVTANDGYKLATLTVTDAGGNAVTVTNNAFAMPESNVTVSATFEALPPNPFSVTFDANGGTAVVQQLVTKGEKASEPTAPTREGYTFAGWYSDSDLTSEFSFDTAITASITLYAKWTEEIIQQAGSISYATTAVEKTTDAAAFTNELTKTGDGTVTYSSNNTAVATVNETSGEVTITGAGTATITATVADSDTYTYETKTATYTITVTQVVTQIGTKAPSEAKAVGDIVFSDGSATPYASGLTLTDAQKAVAVAVIFYVGSGSGTLGEKTLGVGLKNATGDGNTLAWARYTSDTDKAEGYSTNITAIQCTPSESGDGKAATATFTGDLDGSDNWTALCAAVNDEGTSGNYPAWEWVNAYATTANLTGEYASGWYLPTVAELCMLYRVKATMNAALEAAGGTKIADNYHWSSSQSSTNSKAWMVKFDNGKLMDTYKDNKWYVCGVRAF